MKTISRKKLPKEWADRVWSQFVERIGKSGSDKHATRFIDVLLGEAGRDYIVRRLTAIVMLRDKQTYREIRDKLGLSYNTIRALRGGMDDGAYITWRKAGRVLKMKESTGISGSISRKSDIFDSALMDFLLLKVSGRARWRFLNR